MFAVNEFFGGKVKSITFYQGSQKVTAGVMAPGEYTFNTGDKELMKVTAGSMDVKLPGSKGFVTYKAGQEYPVPPNAAFDLKVAADVSYLCYFG
jgi:uncharacterized protein YaiE (UPF0345 family)